MVDPSAPAARRASSPLVKRLGGAVESAAVATSRRQFLAKGSGAAVLALAPRAFAQWQPSQRYPDLAVKVLAAPAWSSTSVRWKPFGSSPWIS